MKSIDLANAHASHPHMEELKERLEAELGYEVVVDKIANRLYVHKVVRATVPIFEIVEQELMLTAEDPVKFFVGEITKPLEPFKFVMLPADWKDTLFQPNAQMGGKPHPCIKTSEHAEYLAFDENPFTKQMCNTDWFPSEGYVPLFTLTSKVAGDLGVAHKDLNTYVKALSRNGEHTVVMLPPGLKEYSNDVMGKYQVWCDVAVLKGTWTLDGGVLKKVH